MELPPQSVHVAIQIYLMSGHNVHLTCSKTQNKKIQKDLLSLFTFHTLYIALDCTERFRVPTMQITQNQLTSYLCVIN